MEEVLERAKNGDVSAFESLVVSHQRQVYSLALRHVGQPEDAFDITQEAFYRAYRGLPTFQGDCTFSTWMYRLTINLCIDHQRKKKRTPSIPFSALEDQNQPLQVPDMRYLPENAAELSELQEALSKALLTLNEEHRTVFILRAVHELSYAEIASILEVEEGTIKSRLSRAREKLRQELIKRGNFWPHSTSK